MPVLVPIFTGIITLLELSNKFSDLAIGQKTLDNSLRGKSVFAKNSIINWFYSNFATTDTKQNVGNQVLGTLTGYVYRSKINSNLYYEIALGRDIGGGFDNEAIWVNFNDLEFANQAKPKQQASSQNILFLVLLGFILFSNE
jgi:hypothetical protein